MTMSGKPKNENKKEELHDLESSEIQNEKEESKKKSGDLKISPPTFSRLMNTVKPEGLMAVVGFILTLASESTNQIIPLIVAKAYDSIIDPNLSSDEKMSNVNTYMGLSLIIFFAGTVAGFFRGAIFAVIGERMVARIRLQLYASVLKQDIAFFDEHKSGELISRLSSDTTLLQNIVSQSVPEAIVSVAKGITSVALTFFISPQLAGVTLASVLAIFVISFPLGKTLGRLSKLYQDALGRAQTYSTEALGSMRTVQSFAAESKELNQFRRHIGDPDLSPWWLPKSRKDDALHSTYSVGFWKSMVTSGFFTLIFGGGFGFLYVSQWYGFYLVNNNLITIGELTAFQSYVFNIGFGFGSAAGHIGKIIEAIGASGRLFYLLDCEPKISKPFAKKETDNSFLRPNSMNGHIEFQNVQFSYPSRKDIKVLDGFTLTVSAGTTTAIVGSSGSGKSTVISLMQRFYDVDCGSIAIDGNDITDLDLHWLRQNIGYVQQEPQLFGVTVRDNLLYGIPENETITQEKMENACREANCHDFICSWPDGYDTLVGERGVQLSGGQKQRICIARALITNCRILLLDEATSALDSESEHIVQEAIDKAVIGRTVIIVAHRLSTIQHATQIVVMSDHKIVGVGTHEELLNNCRKYQDLIKRQNLVSSSSSTALFEMATTN